MSALRGLPPRAALAAAAVAALLGGPGAEAQEPAALPAEIRGEFVVEGRWRMTGDVVVRKTGVLRFRAGAVLEVSAEDDSRKGMSPGICELYVFGRLEAEGTPERPVLLTLAPPGGPKDRWAGVLLRPLDADTRPSVLRHVRIRRAIEGVYVGSGRPRIERCVFDSCRVGLAAGRLVDSAGKDHESGDAEPDVVECLFVGCKTGVGVDGRASPSVVRSTFADGERGVGNDRGWWITHSVASLGARVDRCLFLRNDEAVEGSAVIENSIFLRNGAALVMSDFHGRFSARVDRVAWRRNVLWGNTVLVDGEADLGADNRVVDPRLRGVPDAETVAAATPPLAGVDLLPDSPCRGAALDGGDVGPSGSGPRGRRLRRWTSADRALRRTLVLGPPERVAPAMLPKAAPTAPGDRLGEAWWVAFDADDGGGLDRAALAGGDESAVRPLAWIWRRGGAGGGAVEVEVNADGMVAVWRGDTSVPFPQSPQRHGARGTRLAAGPVAGPQGIVAWWRTDEPTSRIGVAAFAPEGVSLVEPEPPEALAATLEPVSFGPRHAGLRVRPLFHWGDVRRTLTLRLRAHDGSEVDVSGSVAVHDAKGTLRCDVPAGFEKVGATFVVDGLRDVWGRPFSGLPAEVPAVPE